MIFENCKVIYIQSYDDVEFYKDWEDLKARSAPLGFTVLYKDMSQQYYSIENLIDLGLIVKETVSEEEILRRAQEMIAATEKREANMLVGTDIKKPLMITGGFWGPKNLDQALIMAQREIRLYWA